jgi:voltage-gated potassium channel
MTVITLTTVGFTEVHPLSDAGRLFTIGLIAFGIFLVTWVATTLVALVVGEELRSSIRMRRMEREISSLRDHFIVCGHGRMGRQACQDFARAGVPFVVVENNPEELERVRECGMPYVAGDATEDSILLAAGVERARGLIAVAANDAQNTFITLTARKLNPELLIVARSVEESAEAKLLAAGANRVVSPYVIGGRRIAAAALRPTVVEFLETVMHLENTDLAVNECVVGERSDLVGRSLVEAAVRQRTGAVVLAIKYTHDGGLDTHLDPDHALEAGDVLVALGTVAQLQELSRLAQG